LREVQAKVSEILFHKQNTKKGRKGGRKGREEKKKRGVWT
jgi:hypothetical protein